MKQVYRGALAALVALCVASPAFAAEILEVAPDAETKGIVHIGLRDAGDAVPVIKVDDTEVSVTQQGRSKSVKWQPLFMVVDTTNISEERLDKVKTNIGGLAKREFNNGSRLVVVSDQRGVGVEGTSADSVAGAIKTTLEAYKVIPNPDPKGRKPHYSTISQFLGRRLANVPLAKAKPWALVFSSLCVSADDKPEQSLKGFPGPIRFLVWDAGLPDKCKQNRERWLGELRELRPDIEVYNLDDPAQSDKVNAARQGRTDLDDSILTFSGIPYKGGLIKIDVELPGADPWTNTWKEEALPDEWFRQARMERSAQVRIWAAIGFGILVILVIIGAIVRARRGGMEVAKWEAVGEAEDLSTSMDPDAWNATIFQLTGAMPALKEVREAAQLGPAAGAAAKPTTPDEEATKADEKAPVLEEEPTEAAAAAGEAAAPAAPMTPEGAEETAAVPSGAAAEAPPSTGMTVAMPVLDDGTGYEADTPFEIGVLLGGKPVARKTKKFRKVFSIGRATDNRVVIQKDDTVHRYHVVVRPAMKGKEWWLEVSPTSTNRTNLNGKDLRPGGRYRLPARFRLQLGEATEVRGRLSKG